MKKILIVGAFLSCALSTYAQTLQDGLLYSQNEPFGTARYRSMGGAFGALGGDLTGVSQNPAGSTVFSNHYASFSLGVNAVENETRFNSGTAKENDSSFDIPQAGGVLVYKNNRENSAITKFSLGINYDATRSFDNTERYRGSTTSGLGDYFLGFANGVLLDDIQLRAGESIPGVYQFLGQNAGVREQNAFLGYQSFLIDAVDNNDLNNDTYISNTGSGVFNQSYLRGSEGTQGKVAFNGALEFFNKLSIGVNLNSHFINYVQNVLVTETNSNAGASVDRVSYNNILETQGSGFSAQIGAIFKVSDYVRLGATYESPTWYSIDEATRQFISTDRTTSNGLVTEIVNPDVVNIFPTYELQTPGSFTGSIAFILGRSGLISVDYQTRDYSQLTFKPENDPVFQNNNNLATTLLKRAGTLRIGGEYRINNISLRGGYQYLESPYENKDIANNASNYSAGIGYTWGKTVLDVSYNRFEQTYSQELFNGTGQNNKSLNSLVATLGFNL